MKVPTFSLADPRFWGGVLVLVGVASVLGMLLAYGKISWWGFVTMLVGGIAVWVGHRLSEIRRR